MPPPTAKAKAKSKPAILDGIKKAWQRDRKLVMRRVGITLAFLVFTFGILLPLTLKVNELQRKQKELKAAVMSAEGKISRMPELKNQRTAYQKEIADIREGLFQVRELDQLLGDLSKVAIKVNVRIVASKPIESRLELPSPFNQQFLPATFELVIEGGYHEVGMFLNEIERMPKWLLIREVNMQSGRGGSGSELQCTFQVSAFVNVPKKS